MFKSAQLTCFRKHEDLHVDFAQGFVAIRGRNEAGKTTLQEALAYAMFGTKALREPLVDVATWGRSVDELQVIVWLVDGVVVSRSKRGAEIYRETDKVRTVICTGQKECTAYFERMLGASANVAGNLMMASQGNLRGALEGEAGAAVQMIEKLADFDLFERVVGLIQTNLTTGNAAAAEQSVLERQAALDSHEMPVFDANVEAAKVEVLNTNLGIDYEQQKSLSNTLNELDVAGARQFMRELVALDTYHDGMVATVAEAQAQVDEPLPPLAAEASMVADWRERLLHLKEDAAARAAWTALQALTPPEAVWEGGQDSFRAELARLRTLRDTQITERTDIQMRKVKAQAKRINEKQCAFCGKDLDAVPEVAMRNTESDHEVRVITEKLMTLNISIKAVEDQITEMMDVDKAARLYEQTVGRYSPFITLYADQYPARWTWNGEPPAPAEKDLDYNALIRNAEQAQSGYDKALGRRAGALERLATTTKTLDGIKAQRAAMRPQVEAVSERIRAAEQLERRIADLGREIEAGKVELLAARHRYEMLAAAWQRATDVADLLAEQLGAAQRGLDAMRFNNALLKRVRQARPVVADKLWSIVLAAVSSQFSQVRGEQSIVTRTDEGFLCNGKSVKGLSGSTLDALGLAIRSALVKTFLPATRFMMLDEPAAAMDDERESAMLGLVAGMDFDQVLLVTHSTLADSFAAQVVTL